MSDEERSYIRIMIRQAERFFFPHFPSCLSREERELADSEFEKMKSPTHTEGERR